MCSGVVYSWKSTEASSLLRNPKANVPSNAIIIALYRTPVWMRFHDHAPAFTFDPGADAIIFAWTPSALALVVRFIDRKVVVIDGLVDKDLCRDLLDLVTEPGWVTATTNNLSKTRAEPADAHSECNSKYHVGMQPSSAKEGPPTTKWERGLTDVDTDEAGGSTAAPGTGSWGLTNEAMEWLCQDGEHPAIVEVRLHYYSDTRSLRNYHSRIDPLSHAVYGDRSAVNMQCLIMAVGAVVGYC